jgi:hypothetical protein
MVEAHGKRFRQSGHCRGNRGVRNPFEERTIAQAPAQKGGYVSNEVRELSAPSVTMLYVPVNRHRMVQPQPTARVAKYSVQIHRAGTNREQCCPQKDSSQMGLTYELHDQGAVSRDMIQNPNGSKPRVVHRAEMVMDRRERSVLMFTLCLAAERIGKTRAIRAIPHIGNALESLLPWEHFCQNFVCGRSHDHTVLIQRGRGANLLRPELDVHRTIARFGQVPMRTLMKILS